MINSYPTKITNVILNDIPLVILRNSQYTEISVLPWQKKIEVARQSELKSSSLV